MELDKIFAQLPLYFRLVTTCPTLPAPAALGFVDRSAPTKMTGYRGRRGSRYDVLNDHWLKEQIDAAICQHGPARDAVLIAFLKAAYEKYKELRPQDRRSNFAILESLLFNLVRRGLIEKKVLKRPGEITFPVWQQVDPWARGEQG